MKFKKTIRSAVSCAAAAALSVSMMSASASAFDPSVITDCEGYSGKLQFTPGERLNEQLGVLLKETDIDLSLNTVEGGKEIMSGIDFGGERLASLNAFYDEETGYIYVQIPELSEDFLYFDPQEMIDEEGSEEAEEFLSLGTPMIGGYDLDAISEAVNSYGEMIISLLGAGEISTVSSTVAGETEYTFDTVTYELTYTQLSDFANTLADAAEEDETIWELADMFAYESPSDMIYSFFSAWPEEEFVEEYTGGADEDITEVTLYFLDGKASGISSSYLGMENMVLSVFDEKSIEFFDTSISTFDEDDYFTSVKTFSYYENEDGSASGSLRVISETPEESSGITAQFENLLIDDEQIKGSAVIENTLSELPQVYTVEADINAESQYLSVAANEEEELLFSLIFNGGAVEANPASLSIEMAYNLLDEDEMSLYLKNSNSVQFLAHAEEVLGKELFDMIMSMIDLPEPAPDDSDSSEPIVDSSEVEKNGSDSSSSSAASTTTTTTTTTTTAKDPSPETGKALGVGAAMITVLGAAAVIRKRR